MAPEIRSQTEASQAYPYPAFSFDNPPRMASLEHGVQQLLHI